jgi:hypothetical protein
MSFIDVPHFEHMTGSGSSIGDDGISLVRAVIALCSFFRIFRE